jgi:diguanylate cyclase (GGDEF)-like protein
VILVFSVPLYSVTLVEYMAMYLSMIPIDIYMYDNVKKLNSKVFNVLYGILFAALILFDTVVLTLHTLDIIHCVSVVSYLQVLILLNLLYFMVVLILNLRKSETFQRLLIIGMLIIAVCIGYDLVSFYLRRYFGGDSLPLKGVSSMGLMVFIMILFFSFYVNVAEKMMQDAERKSLVKCAYTDELTQLNNRRYCIEYMQKLENEQDVEVAIVSFDLNGLKLVNDTYGHIAGDALLRKAAEIIISTFENSGVVGRMGGDEFIAILVNTPEEDLVDLLERFRSNIMIANSRDEKSQVSIAYGYALSDEIDEFNIEKIYQIADYRMYENKNQSKSK